MCVSAIGVRSVDCLQVEVRGRGRVSLTWWRRAGGRGCKRCRRRSPGECRPERKRRYTERGEVVMRRVFRYTGYHHETKNRSKHTGDTPGCRCCTHTQTHNMHTRVLLEFSTMSLGFCWGRLQAEVGFGFYLRQEGYFFTVRLFVGRIPQKLLTGWRMGLSPE